MKKCLICGEVINKGLKKTCSYICANEYKRQRKLDAEKRLAIKPRREWLKDAERACNAYIRERDRDLGHCISCGGHLGETYHAGHFRSVGSSPHLRFSALNIHAQCVKCNTYLGGNLLGYRKGLSERHGAELVEYLENYNAPAKWTIEDCKDIIEYYKDLLKELKRG